MRKIGPFFCMPVWFKSDPCATCWVVMGSMVLWFACVMASADDATCALQKPLGKAQIRDNYLYFYGWGQRYKVQSVQFDETSHSITEAQPYDGVFSLGTYLDVRAGRHGSEEVAHDFNAGLTPENALGLCTSSDPPCHQSSTLLFSVLCPWPSITAPGSAQTYGLHRATILAQTTGGLQAQSVIRIIKTDWTALAAIIPMSPMSHFLQEAARMF